MGKMDTCTCMAESLHCSPETITTLLIGYTLIQNKEFKNRKRESNKHSLSGWYVPGTVLSVEVHACSVAPLCPTLCDSMDCRG